MATERQAPTAQAERLAIGKGIHEKQWPSMAAAVEATGKTEASLWAWQSEYRKSIGFGRAGAAAAPAGDVDPKLAKKRADDAARKRAKNARIRAAREAANGTPPPLANGNGRHLVRVDEFDALPGQVAQLSAQVTGLERDLEAAHDEIDTLRKILMVVGRTL